MISIETGGNPLFERGVGEQVTGELFDRKLVEGHVAVDGCEHPVTPAPHVAGSIVLVAAGVSVAGRVEPGGRVMFAVAW